MSYLRSLICTCTTGVTGIVTYSSGRNVRRGSAPHERLWRKNILFTLHADSPVVPMDPMLMVWAAANRQTTGGKILGARQAIGVEEALRAMTINAARQGFEEDRKGQYRSREAG